MYRRPTLRSGTGSWCCSSSSVPSLFAWSYILHYLPFTSHAAFGFALRWFMSCPHNCAIERCRGSEVRWWLKRSVRHSNDASGQTAAQREALARFEGLRAAEHAALMRRFITPVAPDPVESPQSPSAVASESSDTRGSVSESVIEQDPRRCASVDVSGVCDDEEYVFRIGGIDDPEPTAHAG